MRTSRLDKTVNDLPLLLIYLTAYAGFHSLLATDRIKNLLEGCCPGLARYYRLTYSLFSVVALYPLFALLRNSPELYTISGPPSYLMRVIQTTGALGFVYAAGAIDLGLFLGYHQPDPATKSADDLSLTGPYRVCRHPLYFFCSLFLVAQPAVSRAYAVFTVWTIAYFWIGSWIEERRLINQYGETYIAYRDQVPHFIPFPRNGKASPSR